MGTVQDVNKIVEKTREVLEGLLHAYPEVSSIGLTGQMHGILYVESGRQMYQSFVYLADGRVMCRMSREDFVKRWFGKRPGLRYLPDTVW